jgi:hypothetical protein
MLVSVQLLSCQFTCNFSVAQIYLRINFDEIKSFEIVGIKIMGIYVSITPIMQHQLMVVLLAIKSFDTLNAIVYS